MKRSPPPRRVRDAVGAVVFCDDSPWDSFVALSAYLRRSGLRTIRVTTLAAGRERLEPLFDRTILLSPPNGPDYGDLASLLEGEPVVDVQPTEFVADAAYAALIGRVGAEATHGAWRARRAAIDKFVVSSRLRAAGIAVPDFCAAEGVTTAEAIETCGLPMVFKPRVGAGGVGMTVITSSDQLAELLDVPGDRQPGILERFIDGEAEIFGGVACAGAVAAHLTYRSHQRQFQHGPSRTIVVTDDDVMTTLGQRVIGELGLDGFVGVGAIRDRKGDYFVHDVNPRLWGSAVTAEVAGKPVLAAYARALGGTPPRRARRASSHHRHPHGGPLPVFPSGVDDAVAGAAGLSKRWRLWRWCRPYVATCGADYVASELERRRREAGD